MDDFPRLIEHGFPLRETSLASVHEKNVRLGHISTLHIWPARRPLAACRAALIATLMPDPGDPKKREEIYRRLAGVVPAGAKDAKDISGGILLWGRESGPDFDWFREEIRKAFGGRAPRVLDPFAGGGAIPLEAMKLGCATTAMDINPVAWFILKCTLEYPQRFARKRQKLPDFARRPGDGELAALKDNDGDLTDHVRLWGAWVLERARQDLLPYYPEVDGKPTVAYLWARTVTCKNCRGVIPLLKTRWLSKTKGSYVILTMAQDQGKHRVAFGIKEVAAGDGVLAKGTMTRTGASCPFCPAVMTMEDLRLESRAGRMDKTLTAVVVNGPNGKEYRLPTATEVERAADASEAIPALYADIPFGLPTEAMPTAEALGFRVPLYGVDEWQKLFMPRQLLALGTFVKHTREVAASMRHHGYDEEWIVAVVSMVACVLDRAANYQSTVCIWEPVAGEVKQTFLRYALPMTWDFGEANPIQEKSRIWRGAIESVCAVLARNISDLARSSNTEPTVVHESAIAEVAQNIDLILTDPPYYDAIPYSDLMDFFYVWLRRTLWGLDPQMDREFESPLSPKWDHDKHDGELIDDSSRCGGNRAQSRKIYEDGMFRAFEAADHSLTTDGRMVIVFAHKNPDAWEALVSALIRAGFIVDASWPIATEMRGGVRNYGRASLASSIWLVCKKRPANAKPGWDEQVEEEMRANITDRLRDYWDAGIRGPDFVWSAIGPALEAYSKYPRVKRLAAPGEVVTVAEFLTKVRREVVAFAAGRVLHRSSSGVDSELDGLTTYYLLHRHDFGLDSVPVGASILYAIACDLSDTSLVGEYDLLDRGKSAGSADVGSSEESEDESEGTPRPDRSMVRLKQWKERERDTMGYSQGVRTAPLIDRIHRLMRIWSGGDRAAVNTYIAEAALDADPLTQEVIQAIIELCTEREADERSKLEAISNHLSGLRPSASAPPSLL